MIQIYKPDNINFNMNGDAVLHPLSCYVNLNLNGSWTLELINIIDNNIDLFVKESVIAAPTPYGAKQLFRVYDIEKSDNQIKCTARPIFLDARYDCFLIDVRSTDKTGQEALNDILASNSKYSGESDITKVSTAYYQMKNAVRAISGDDENSFLNRWGGEIVYDNFKIIVNERIGSSDKNIRCKRGLNQLGIKERIQSNNVITRIIPKGYNGRILPNNETIDSERINAYPYAKIAVFEYDDIKLTTDENIMDSDEVYESIDEFYQALRNRTKKEYDVNQVDIPDILYDVEMIDQYNLDEYKQFKKVMACQLGDDLIIDDEKLKINDIKARIIGLKFNCITRENESLIIGKYTKSFFDETSKFNHTVKEVINTKNNTLMGNKIQGIIDLMTTSLKAQKNIAQKQDVRAILFEDLDPDSETFGALCIGTVGMQISKKRNETDTDWVWGTAINFESIIADFIITGILTDKLGNNSWNLDTGYLVTRYLKATDAEVTGKIIATSGSIAGFVFDANTMTATVTKTFDYTQSDLDTIKNLIMNGTTPTTAQLQRYNISGDGYISSRDYVRIQKIINNGNKVTTTFRLNPDFSSSNNNSPILEISNDAFGKTTVDQLGYLYSKVGNFDNLYIGNTQIDDKFAEYSPIGAVSGKGADLLWQGLEYQPSFTIDNLRQYKYLLIRPALASDNILYAWIVVPITTIANTTVLRGMGGYETTSETNGAELYFVRGSMSFSDNSISIVSCYRRYSASLTSQANATKLYVECIVGVK